jgi:hypothetical protein
MKNKSMKSLLILGVVLVTVTSCSKEEPGPKTDPCGIVEVTTAEVIAGVQFPIGSYQINTFGMTCEEVMGDTGLFNQFLQLGDNDPLPAPWSHLNDAIGQPKFVKSENVGFRAERIN